MKKGLLPIYLSAIILAFATIIFVLKGNYEFIVYAVTLFPLIWIIIKTDRIFNYHWLAKWGFAVWMLSHMAGGSFWFNGTRLYDLILINLIPAPYNILRYDQLVHGFCYLVMTVFVYAIVTHLSKPKSSKVQIIVITFLASLGISALNEIVEFVAVAFFHSTGVGDYYNNALDLVFNAAGSAIALVLLSFLANKTNKK